ncbi:hypothetical protein [Peribacillus asahii]|nr:hypothetical protein [Peribacillus asahii]USK69659.1 hypothetical protein LIS76_19375 [Peribacillus asahii]
MEGAIWGRRVDKVYTDPIDMEEKYKPIAVTPNEEVITLFLLLCKYK